MDAELPSGDDLSDLQRDHPAEERVAVERVRILDTASSDAIDAAAACISIVERARRYTRPRWICT